MNYEIIQNERDGKYYIRKSDSFITSIGYDVVLCVVKEKYAIVGQKDNLDDIIRYGLIDLNGQVILKCEYKCLYPHKEGIYCSSELFPLNLYLYSGVFKWQNKEKAIYSKLPFTFTNPSNAICIDDTKAIETQSGDLAHQVFLINQEGQVIESHIDKPTWRIKEDLLKKASYPKKYVKIEVLSTSLEEKWKKLDEIAKKRIIGRDIFFDIHLTDFLYLQNVRIDIRANKFLLVYTEKTIAILNDSLKLIYFDPMGFHYIFLDEIFIINQKLILHPNGELYPIQITFDEIDYYDDNGYLRFISKNKIGYLNTQGVVLVPPIFPRQLNTNFRQPIWDEQDLMGDYYSDAFEDDAEATWNVD